jgi:hypothetical protein
MLPFAGLAEKGKVAMPKAVLKNGVIYLLEPLPTEWSEGEELEVNKPSEGASLPDAADQWFARMETLVADMTPEEDARLQAAIDALRRESKERARRVMESPE